MRATEYQMELINRLAKKPLSLNDVEVFKALLIDSNPTAYNTIVQNDLKSKFIHDIKEGKVGLLLVHNDMSLNVGRFFDTEFDGNDLYGWVYIPKDGKYETFTGQDIIDNINNGVYRAVSIGFTTSFMDYECSLCGNNYYSLDCEHFAGMEYDGEVCNVLIGNKHNEGRLLEVSIVPAGAAERAEFVFVGEEAAEGISASFYKYESSCKNGACLTFGDKKFKAKKVLNLYGNFKGGNMDKELLEKLEKLAAEKAALEKDLELLKAKQENFDELQTKVEKLEKENEELRVVKDKTLDENKELTEKYEKVAGQFEVVEDLMKEYGVKAEGQNFNEEDFQKLSVEEKVEKFKEFLNVFVETFQPGKKSTTEEKDEIFVGLESYKIAK